MYGGQGLMVIWKRRCNHVIHVSHRVKVFHKLWYSHGHGPTSLGLEFLLILLVHIMCFLIIVDSYTKWMDIHITNSSSAAVTNEKLRQTFSTLGLPKLIASDNGHAFTSSELRLFLKENGIIHKRCALNHPNSNGLAERGVQTFKDGMKKLSGSIYRNTSLTISIPLYDSAS